MLLVSVCDSPQLGSRGVRARRLDLLCFTFHAASAAPSSGKISVLKKQTKNSLFLSASVVAVRLVETVAITLKYAGLTVAKTSSRIPVKIKGENKD